MNTQAFPDQNQLLVSLREMAEQASDPMKKMLAQMALQKAESALNGPVPGTHSSMPSRHSHEKMRQDIQTLLQLNLQMREAYRSLEESYSQQRAWNQKASRSLGACECWGLNPHCPDCQGKGIAGVFEADVEGFQQLMQPFIQRIIETAAQVADSDGTGTEN